MLKLISSPPAFGEPSASPFVVKAMCLLQMAGVEWQASGKGDPRKAPKGKLPLLIDGETLIPDSEEIRSYLEQKYNVDFDQGLTSEQRATSRAVIRMMDEHLYFIVVHERWLNDANWEIAREVFFGMIPKLLRGLITSKLRKKVRDSMAAQGIGRHSDAERVARADEDIPAAMALLGGKPFIFGDTPTAADASAAPMIGAIATLPTDTPLRKRVVEDADLMAYLARVKAAVYPA